MIFPKPSCSWQLLYLVVLDSDLGFIGGFQTPKWLLLAIQLLDRMHVLSSPKLDILSLSYITTISKDHSDFSGMVWRGDQKKKKLCVHTHNVVVWLFGLGRFFGLGRSLSLTCLRIPGGNGRKLCIQVPGRIYLQRNYQG